MTTLLLALMACGTIKIGEGEQQQDPGPTELWDTGEPSTDTPSDTGGYEGLDFPLAMNEYDTLAELTQLCDGSNDCSESSEKLGNIATKAQDEITAFGGVMSYFAKTSSSCTLPGGIRTVEYSVVAAGELISADVNLPDPCDLVDVSGQPKIDMDFGVLNGASHMAQVFVIDTDNNDPNYIACQGLVTNFSQNPIGNDNVRFTSILMPGIYSYQMVTVTKPGDDNPSIFEDYTGTTAVCDGVINQISQIENTALVSTTIDPDSLLEDQ